jgi:hypothetical protein
MVELMKFHTIEGDRAHSSSSAFQPRSRTA